MTDYIDRDELLKKHIHFVKGKEFGLNRPVAVVKTKDILNMPSIDAIEQKHGHWDYYGYDEISNIHIYRCSECECGSREAANYCGNCGTKMDEVTE